MKLKKVTLIFFFLIKILLIYLKESTREHELGGEGMGGSRLPAEKGARHRAELESRTLGS